MADTLIARLSNIREINVRPISSVRKLLGPGSGSRSRPDKSMQVDAVLDGQILKAGEKVRGDGAPLAHRRWRAALVQSVRRGR
jgi:hypothetical protein